MKKLIFSLSLLLLGFSVTAQIKINQYQYKIQKNINCRNGAVASAHPLASKVGVAILQTGGNAIDAAIATQLALAVVYPAAGNLGGGGFLIGRMNNGKTIALDYREMAPASAGRDMYLDEKGNPITNLSLDGHLASGIPGTVAGLFASAKYGKLPFKKLIQPAIDLAEKGFTLTEREANNFNELDKEFRKLNTVLPVFVKEGGWKAGDTLFQKDLAKTLKRIRDNGQKGFYEGETARLITEEMKRGSGIITLEDLKSYTAKERTATIFDYKGHTVITMPPPSSGGIIIQQMLKMIEKRDIGAYGFHSPQAVQLMAETERRSFADRAKFLGDPDFVKIPVKTLVSEKYLTERMVDYTPDKAGKSEDIKAGNITESEETTHLCVIDKWGNAVSVTTTLNNSYGSKTVVGGAGFILNDEMDDFSVKPGVPNMYGAIGAEANAIAPGKRMLSSMTPTIVLKNNQPFLIVGTPGGTTIPTSVYQSIVNIIDFKLSTDDAVNKPKFHHQWLPDVLMIEKGFPQATITALEKMGYKITMRGGIGRTEIIKVDFNKSTKKYSFEAVADNRGDDSAEGY
jgi:gamma-glutamyltranspeptidase / glutathione hydrolase